MNVTLIGMSGAGKSTIGRRVAETLGLTFIDIDHVLESSSGKNIPDLLSDLGDEKFIAAESDATISATSGSDNQLIATGGSVIYSDVAMRHLREISTVVYVRVSTPVLIERISKDSDRASKIVRLRGTSISQLIEERIPLYEKYAHFVVDLSESGAAQDADMICDRISANG